MSDEKWKPLIGTPSKSPIPTGILVPDASPARSAVSDAESSTLLPPSPAGSFIHRRRQAQYVPRSSVGRISEQRPSDGDLHDARDSSTEREYNPINELLQLPGSNQPDHFQAMADAFNAQPLIVNMMTSADPYNYEDESFNRPEGDQAVSHTPNNYTHSATGPPSPELGVTAYEDREHTPFPALALPSPEIKPEDFRTPDYNNRSSITYPILSPQISPKTGQPIDYELPLNSGNLSTGTMAPATHEVSPEDYPRQSPANEAQRVDTWGVSHPDMGKPPSSSSVIGSGFGFEPITPLNTRASGTEAAADPQGVWLTPATTLLRAFKKRTLNRRMGRLFKSKSERRFEVRRKGRDDYTEAVSTYTTSQNDQDDTASPEASSKAGSTTTRGRKEQQESRIPNQKKLSHKEKTRDYYVSIPAIPVQGLPARVNLHINGVPTNQHLQVRMYTGPATPEEELAPSLRNNVYDPISSPVEDPGEDSSKDPPKAEEQAYQKRIISGTDAKDHCTSETFSLFTGDMRPVSGSKGTILGSMCKSLGRPFKRRSVLPQVFEKFDATDTPETAKERELINDREEALAKLRNLSVDLPPQIPIQVLPRKSLRSNINQAIVSANAEGPSNQAPKTRSGNVPMDTQASKDVAPTTDFPQRWNSKYSAKSQASTTTILPTGPGIQSQQPREETRNARGSMVSRVSSSGSSMYPAPPPASRPMPIRPNDAAKENDEWHAMGCPPGAHPGAF